MEITLQTTLDGRRVAVINGKTYGITAFFESTGLEGPFAFVFSGATPLRMTDLALGWKVISPSQGRSGIAIALRPFAYYTISGDDSPEGWPRLKKAADYYAFVGPTETAIHTQIRLVVAQYRPDLEDQVEAIIDTARRVGDACGHWPDALLVKTSRLRIEQEDED